MRYSGWIHCDHGVGSHLHWATINNQKSYKSIHVPFKTDVSSADGFICHDTRLWVMSSGKIKTLPGKHTVQSCKDQCLSDSTCKSLQATDQFECYTKNASAHLSNLALTSDTWTNYCYIGKCILLTAALLKLKVFHPIPLACLARELLSMQGKLVNNNQTFSETKLL